MDQATKLTPMQIDVVQYLHEKQGELVPWKHLQRKFEDPKTGEPDERLAESVWGLIEAGIVFEPAKKPTNYHLTEEACRAAPTIIQGRAAAVAAEEREIARLAAVAKGRKIIRPDVEREDGDFITTNRGMTETPKPEAPDAKTDDDSEKKGAKRGARGTTT